MRPRLLSFELAWTDAAFDAIFPEPPRSALAHGVLRMHPGAYFEEVLRTVPFEQSLGLRFALWMIALAPLFTIRRAVTIASLGVDDRQRVLDALLASRSYVVRQLTMSMKAISALLYSQSKTIRAQMATPVRGRDALVALRKKGGESERAEADEIISETRVKRGSTGHENAAE